MSQAQASERLAGQPFTLSGPPHQAPSFTAWVNLCTILLASGTSLAAATDNTTQH